MGTSKNPYSEQLRGIAELILAVAGESVTVMKRNAPERALKLKRHDEWGIYLEFLKVMFNLTDRLSILYLPIKDQPLFMDSLEDAVTLQLKSVLEPAFGTGADQTEIMLTVGAAVAESRQTYERYRFLVTEDTPEKTEMLKDFGGRVADAMGIAGNEHVSSAATLCASAVIPAIKAVLAGDAPPAAAVNTADPATATASTLSPPPATPEPQGPTGTEIKLVSVMSTVEGEEVETRWGLHPRFRQDLPPEDMQQVTRLMNRVAKILGERYASVAFSDEWTSWHKAGHA
ncbi:MAG: hypothetical protein Q8L74_09915 [Nitrospirota bacterium]|nr:hypothetical protein [Nitrospirota bacterium]MDP2382980.1 hypothetical protein [Nitrospirota bacterium]MDP3598362.1 hypothetical protein [Nitrospirota bacterium]